jgi:single-strand DNA-binding protein
MDYTTLTGLVATTPRFITTQEGLEILSFRLATSPLDGDTNWYTITAFGQTAQHGSVSIEKGHRVIVAGRLTIRDWDNGERTGTSVEVEADSIGHDLVYGTSVFSRTVFVRPEARQEAPAEPAPMPAPVPAHSCNCSKCDK